MNGLEATLFDVASRLTEQRVGFALVGGLAVSARTEARFTRDVDLVVAVNNDAEAESLVRGFLNAGFGVLATIEHEVSGRLATVRLMPPGQTEEGVVVDLLFASSGIEKEIVDSADRIEVFPELPVPVATLAHLITLKVLSRDEARPQDDADLRSLLHEANNGDIEIARRALSCITERGYQRGRNLAAGIDSALRRWGHS